MLEESDVERGTSGRLSNPSSDTTSQVVSDSPSAGVEAEMRLGGVEAGSERARCAIDESASPSRETLKEERLKRLPKPLAPRLDLEAKRVHDLRNIVEGRSLIFSVDSTWPDWTLEIPCPTT